jgi:hypothetical protein
LREKRCASRVETGANRVLKQTRIAQSIGVKF